MIDVAGRVPPDLAALPRYQAMLVNKFATEPWEIRSAGSIGATMIRLHQVPGDWSDDPSGDIVASIGYTKSTRFSFSVAGQQCRERLVTRTAFVVTSPGSDSSFVMEDPMDTLVVALPFKQLASHFWDEGLPENGDFSALHAVLLDDATTLQTMERLWRTLATGGPGSGLEADGYALQVLASLIRLSSRQQHRPSGGLSSWQIRQCREMLEASGDTVFSLAEMAASARLSTFHFARAFRESFGVPPYRYQMMVRVKRACALLETTDLSITDIALAVGYDNSQSLSRAFRSAMGVSPQAYRKAL